MIVPYAHEEHYQMLGHWLAHRGIPVPDKDMFSTFGYCVDDIAIGFLFFTNSKQAYIDNIAVDPTKDHWTRDNCIVFLLHALEQAAVDHGCKLVTVLGNLPTMKKRFEKLAFKPHGDYTLYAKVPGTRGD